MRSLAQTTPLVPDALVARPHRALWTSAWRYGPGRTCLPTAARPAARCQRSRLQGCRVRFLVTGLRKRYSTGSPRVRTSALADVGQGANTTEITVPTRYKGRVFTWDLDTTAVKQGSLIEILDTLAGASTARYNQALAAAFAKIAELEQKAPGHTDAMDVLPQPRPRTRSGPRCPPAIPTPPRHNSGLGIRARGRGPRRPSLRGALLVDLHGNPGGSARLKSTARWIVTPKRPETRQA